MWNSKQEIDNLHISQYMHQDEKTETTAKKKKPTGIYDAMFLFSTSYVTLKLFEIKFAWVSKAEQSLQNWIASHNECRKWSQDIMPYYLHLLFRFSDLCHIHPIDPTQSEVPQEGWVEVHRAKSNSFVLCLHRAAHVCFHRLSHRTNQTAFRSFDHLYSCWNNYFIHHGNFTLNDEIISVWIIPNHMTEIKTKDLKRVFNFFKQLTWVNIIST